MKTSRPTIWTSAGLLGLAALIAMPAAADFVIADDLIVDGSACVGFDCVNGESFGFDTIRLKENNLRIKFDDTSTAASFPSNDWQLTANDSANGGANKFSIDDISGGRTPFTIEAGAPSNSLYVDDGGRLGLGTAIPVVDVHIVSGNTPTLRLQQDGSSGFTPQTWDVAGNEVNFFIRDATNGSKLPLRIRPSAPTSSIDVASSGFVGLDTSSPAAALHIARDDNDSVRLRVENTDAGGTDARVELVADTGSVFFDLCADCTIGVNQWRFTAAPGATGNFAFQRVGFASSVMSFDGSTGAITVPGDLTVDGTFSNPSSRGLKQGFAPVDGQEMLTKLASVPITEWQYKADAEGRRHVGPVTEDFEAAFGLGTKDGTHIVPLDVQGVTIAALQGLNEKVDEKSAEIEALRAQVEELKALLQEDARR